MSRILASTLTLLLASSAYADELSEARTGYAELLEKHVKDGRVDYAGFDEASRGKLDRYLSAIASAQLPEARAARIGFLVDAYNALVLRAVLRHKRPRSVLDVKGFFDTESHTIAGRELTLDALEKKVLNPFAKDPRTHFVLVCGAVGCPILESRPFYGSSIEARLEAATRRYLRSPAGARAQGGRLQISKLFDWYAKDFGGADGVLEFIRPRLPENLSELSRSGDIGYIDYNWTLNQQ